MHPSDTQTWWLLQILASLFLAILFLQSGIDKIVDRKGNLDFLMGHFAKSPLAKTVGPMFTTILILEVVSGLLSGIGCVLVVLTRDPSLAFWGATLSAISLSALFFGQRVGKDYAGAAVLVPYFLLALAAMWILGIGHLVTI